MKTFLIQFKWSDPYPKDANYRKTATSMATATNRGIKEWKKVHGRGVKTLSINISTL